MTLGSRPGRVVVMITVSDLTKRYGGFTAVDHVDFMCRPGRVTGFLGPNGSVDIGYRAFDTGQSLAAQITRHGGDSRIDQTLWRLCGA